MSMPGQELILALGRTEFFVRTGDIALSDADVLVNSSGTGSEEGLTRGTVSKAIRQAGGHLIFDELRAHEPLVPGDVIVTGAGTLKARYIFHAVVVGWSDEQRVLQATIWRAVSKSMALAQLMGVPSIALPALGTGSGGANRWETHSSIAAACLETFRTDSALRRILFCFLTPDESADFRRAFYQQQLVRELRGLCGGGGEQGQLSAALGNLYKRLLEPASDIDEIKRVVEQTMQSSPRAVEYYIVSNYGSGSIAVGDGAQAAGERGVIVGGNHSGAISTGGD
jgi:O-acetyl-ADP-ribose deacetylase (regulator of RNase III)